MFNLLKSLRGIVDHDLREWRKNNVEYQQYRLRWWENYFLQLEKQPFLHSLDIVLLGLTITLVTILIENNTTVSLDEYISTALISRNPGDTGSNNEVLLSYFTSLWGVQAAIVGLIYPIAIAFVSILLQRTPRSEIALDIYLIFSAARSSGSRSLALVLLMGAQYLLLVNAGHETILIWLIFDGLIFIENISGTFWFLAQTFAFLSGKLQDNFIKRYAIAVIWPRQLEEVLCENIFAASPKLKLLPAKEFGDGDAKGEPQALCFPLGHDRGLIEARRFFRGEEQLVDVWYRLLALVVKWWRARALSQVASKNIAEQADRDAPRITFPLRVGLKISGETPLCVVNNGPLLTFIEKLLVRWSFRFRAKEPNNDLNDVGELFKQYSEQLMYALRDERSYDVDAAIKKYTDLISSLIKAGDYTTDQGTPDNFAKLGHPWAFAGWRFYQEWVVELRDPIKKTAERCLREERYVSPIANVPNRIASELDVYKHHDIIAYSFEVWTMLSWFISEQWAREVEAQGEEKQSYAEPAHLRPPFQNRYKDVVRTLLERWESLQSYHLLPRREEQASWNQLCVIGDKLLAPHLDALIKAYFYFIHCGDETGADRFVDGLLKWLPHTTVTARKHDVAEIQSHSAIGLEVFERNWPDVEKRYTVPNPVLKESRTPHTVYSIAIANYWCDALLTACGILIRWATTDDSPNRFPLDQAKHLLDGSTPHPGDNTLRIPLLDSADDIVYAMLRQRQSHSLQPYPHSGRLSHLAEQILNLEGTPRMAGRIHSAWVEGDFHAMANELLLVLLLKIGAKGKWSPSSKLISFVTNQVARGDWDGESVTRLFEEWIAIIEDSNFDGFQQAYNAYYPNSGQGSFTASRLAAKNGLHILRDRATETRNQQIINANIDQTLLIEIGRWASASEFSAKGKLPLFFFKDNSVIFVEATLAERSLILNNVNKARYTTPQLEDRAVNEESWFSITVGNHVAVQVLSEVLKQTDFQIEDATNPETYWALIREFSLIAKNKLLSPILLTSRYGEPAWLEQWLGPYRNLESVPLPHDMRVWYEENQTDEYRANLNDVEVYWAPIPHNVSFLMMKEAFDTAKFHRYDAGRFVDVTTEPVEENPLLINLRLTWQMEIEAKKLPAIELRHDTGRDSVQG